MELLNENANLRENRRNSRELGKLARIWPEFAKLAQRSRERACARGCECECESHFFCEFSLNQAKIEFYVAFFEFLCFCGEVSIANGHKDKVPRAKRVKNEQSERTHSKVTFRGGTCSQYQGKTGLRGTYHPKNATHILSWIADRDWFAKRVVTFALDRPCDLGVQGASARQVVNIMENNVFALIGTWLAVMTPLR